MKNCKNPWCYAAFVVLALSLYYNYKAYKAGFTFKSAE